MNPILSTIPNTRNWLLTKPYAAIDTEFRINFENKSKPYTLFAASIVDNNGVAQFRHITDFHTPRPEKELVKWLMGQMLGFRLTLSWYGTGVKIIREDGTIEGKDSDLKVIDSVCNYYDIPSIVEFNKIGIPYVRGYDLGLCTIDSRCALWNRFRKYYHIDLYQVYKKPVVKSIIYNNKYRSLGLDAVCRALLNEGKLEGLDGSQIQKMSKVKQLDYVTQDAHLVIKLAQHNNYEVLDLMSHISTLINVSYERVCHTGISTWWSKIIQDKIAGGGFRVLPSKIEKRKYVGGYVINPKIGFYHDLPVYVLDVKSLYPSIMISHNISFDTVNCDCCKDSLEAKVDRKIMDIINSTVAEDQKREHYWICMNDNYRGIIPRLLREFRDKRFSEQEKGNDQMQLALKIFMNGCYGIFGSDFFEFADYRVAELTTAYGRLTLQYMQHIAKEVYGFDIIYGDTDSLFVTGVKKDNDIMKFIAECSILLDIDVEQSKLFTKFLITKKKHYIGVFKDVNEEPEIKGMEGFKSDRPQWLSAIQKQLANDIKFGHDPTINIRKEYLSMESGQVPIDKLPVKITLKKDPSLYPINSLQRTIGIEKSVTKGDAVSYFKSSILGGGTCNADLVSRKKYLEMLRTTVEDVLHVMGYDFMQDILGYTKIEDYVTRNQQCPLRMESTSLGPIEDSDHISESHIQKKGELDIRSLIRCKTVNEHGYTCVWCTPATGILYITNRNPSYISGQIRTRGRDEGRYPYNYLEMIDNLFGPERNTIEVCSRSVAGINRRGSCFTVDINPNCNPDLVTDGQILAEIPDNKFSRWRCDPPYNEMTAKMMYGTSLPKTSKLLQAGARVCKPGSLMFLLLGPKNYQPCPPGVKKIGMISISIIPNNEIRILNIFYKFS